MQPILGNDRTLDEIDPQLANLDDVFNHPDYQIRYSRVRRHLIVYVDQLQKSLPYIQQQINELRQGASLTKDAQDAAQLHDIAAGLQHAYDKQKQLSTDLTGVAQAMMEYSPPADLDVAQQQMAESQIPPQMRDIKSYLRFDGQRDAITQAENAAADSAITLVENRCALNK